ncbi:hypothetical protein BDK51DRAFT_37953 [Blyttiomyces helicus]|uniref:GON domain-containing protein n=1 Tax=Blyttiomyces helicus TaxID=388810 RepID=A0A4P9WMZ1_9FUNG|nr:hypothetical protein BDK51DRAFT_37953 [Blyttiomyces helicus]|eukprot:RKO92570.1 hypothetical protein BDK51DRAFT_37953 [Blyttiomyces helicus]
MDELASSSLQESPESPSANYLIKSPNWIKCLHLLHLHQTHLLPPVCPASFLTDGERDVRPGRRGKCVDRESDRKHRPVAMNWSIACLLACLLAPLVVAHDHDTITFTETVTTTTTEVLDTTITHEKTSTLTSFKTFTDKVYLVTAATDTVTDPTPVTSTLTLTASATTETFFNATATTTVTSAVTPTVTIPPAPPCNVSFSTPYVPGPCATLLSSAPASPDGDYNVTLPGSGTEASVYCFNMSTGSPLEYINLQPSYSQNIGIHGAATQLTFTKARLLLTNPTAFFIDLYDLTFAEVSTHAPGVSAPLSLGEANSCSSRDRYASSVVDINGTDFSFANPTINFWGMRTAHEIISNTAKVIAFEATGHCGGGILAGRTTTQCLDKLVPGAIIGPCSESVGDIYNVHGPADRNRLVQVTSP